MRILIVEDEQKIADALKRGLEQRAYAVDVAYDGAEGYGRALAGNYDLFIIDRMLPNITDGLEIARALRAAKKSQPVLMLTARDATPDRVEGLDSGADDYLVKPFAFEELLARIRALLRRPDKTTGSIIKVGDLELSPQNCLVRRQGRPIHLSKKEFALLEYMMRHAGQVLSKEQLTAHVWDFDADILPNTVESFVGALRQKLEKPFDGPDVFKTIRGFGYKLIV